MSAASDPQPLSRALSELIAMRGLARVRAQAQLSEIWGETAGAKIAAQTSVIGIRRGVLQVGVSNSPMLSELVSFHKTSLVAQLKEQHGDLRIRDIKFVLRSGISRPA